MRKMELLGSRMCKSLMTRKIDRILWCSSDASSASFSSPATSRDSLFGRISPIGDPNASMLPILDEWAREGHTVSPIQLTLLAQRLTKFKRFSHALQVSQWREKMSIELSPNDLARKLDLISRVQGLNQAEEYFHTLPPSSRSPQVYNALLSCYVRWKSVEKAEELMRKLKELKLARIPLPYNAMIKLYIKLGMHERADLVMHEMEDMDVPWDKFTYNLRLNAYVSANDITGMELLLRKMEGDPRCKVDWVVYSVVANGYLHAGQIDKSLAMIKRVEKLGIGRGGNKLAYPSLLTLYGRAKRKDQVYRLWGMLKSSPGGMNSRSYLYMVSSLVKVDDVEGAEKIVEEYCSRDKNKGFDYRITNLLMRAFGVRGEMEKARVMVEKGAEHGKEPPMSTWDILAAGYCKHKRMEEAVEACKKALMADRQGWRMNTGTISSCFKYLKKKGGPGEDEEFRRLVLDRAEGLEAQVVSDPEIGESVETDDVNDELLNDDGDDDNETLKV